MLHQHKPVYCITTGEGLRKGYENPALQQV